ncbi:MAG: YceI family protein [Thermoanaerobaculia bacterium]
MSHPRKAVLFLPLLLTALTGAAWAEPRVLVLDPAASKVSFLLDATGHDVEGTMAVKSGRVTFDPATGQASGEISIDLKSARTGNDSRDKTMHDDVLQTGSYPTAVFRAEKVRGALAPSGPSRIQLDGTLSFHGGEHKVTLPAQVEVRDGRLTGDARFEVPYVAWGLKDPSIMILRVGKKVDVTVHAVGSLEGAAVAAAGVR